MSVRPYLRRLANRLGILPAFVDATGQRHLTSDGTRLALLAAMGLDASTEYAACHTLAALTHQQRSSLNPILVLFEREAQRVSVKLPWLPRSKNRADWHAEIIEEAGRVRSFRGTEDIKSGLGSCVLDLGDSLPVGYYSLRVRVEAPRGESHGDQTLIVTPRDCVPHSTPLHRRRAFGIWTNLYTLRSASNWGLGDLNDLKALARWAGSHGAQFLGINPLHAIAHYGYDASPYAPVTRLFRNIIYLNIEAVPEFAQFRESGHKVLSKALTHRIARWRASDRICYEEIYAEKRRVLRRLYEEFVRRHQSVRSERWRAFRAYVSKQGDLLQQFATFLALEEHFHRRPGHAERKRRPPAYRTMNAEEVAQFQHEHLREIDFHCYVLFELDRQLAEVARVARASGLKMGIYHDLAISSAADGFDLWAYPDLFAKGASLGAPPDFHSKEGQNWECLPLIPWKLRLQAYRYWIEVLRRNFSHAGMLRIDHVMGLFRQFWIPQGRPPSEGAYVRYPARELLAILALESRRNSAVVVGEDLGTVPRGMAATLERWGILSTRVLYFEKDKEGRFRSARSYHRHALVMANTHDHAPLAGHWGGVDVRIRRKIGVIRTDRALHRALKERAEEWAELLSRLAAEGILITRRPVGYPEILRAVYKFLARTPSRLVAVALDDLAGETVPVNLPGLPRERYPSWSRRMSRSVEELVRDGEVSRLLREISRELSGKRSARSR